jgi:hypothetical protein
MISKLKKYTVKWSNGETTRIFITNEQAKNMRMVVMVKSVTLVKK